MKISIEISLYPLAEDKFKTEIWAFIKRLRLVDGLSVVTNGMSTQVFNAAVFICKFIGGDRSVVEAES